MPDLTAMTGVDTTRWLDRTSATLKDVLALVDRRVTDTDLIDKYADLANWLDDLPADMEITAATLDLLRTVGPDVLAADPDGADQWAGLAPLAEEVTGDPWDTLHEFVKAGRGPGYARGILEAAKRYEVRVNEYGYGEEITPSVFADLADAGLGGHTLGGYREQGYSIADAIRLHVEGITPTVVARAVADGLPRSQWAEAYRGVPESWLTDVLDRLHGWTLDDLRYLAAKGWATPQGGYRRLPVSNPAYISADPAKARAIADAGVASYDEVKRYGEAIYGGIRSVSLVPGARGNTEVVAAAVLRLARIGVKPSHLAEFRMAHARNLDDVEALVRDGLTAARLAELRKAQPTVSKWNKTREWPSLAAVRRAHAKALEAEQVKA